MKPTLANIRKSNAMNIRVQMGAAPVPRGERKTAKARQRASKLNKTEQRYADLLEETKRYGHINEYFVQAVALKLGEGSTYWPDFLVIHNDGSLEFVEVKGYMKAVGAAKFKIARTMFWWAKFTMLSYAKGSWVENENASRNKRPGE
jgi:hypothetical protein